MSIDIQLFEKNFAKDLNNLHVLVSWAAQQQLTGSYGDRRPDLGKMFTCPSCHTRRRQGAPKCCNSAYAQTQRAWDVNHNVLGTKSERQEKGFGPTTRHEKHFHQMECEERVIANFFPKGFLKRLMHKKHGQNKPFRIRQLSSLFRQYPALLKAAVTHMQCGKPVADDKGCRIDFDVPAPEHVGAFAEKYFIWTQAQAVRKEKAQQRLSRKINREN